MLFALTRAELGDKEKMVNSIKKDFTTVKEKTKFQQIIKIENKTKEKISELSSMAKVSVTEKYISIQLPNPILFDLGKVDLNDQGKDMLRQIAEILKLTQQQVVVEGHTDDKPLGVKSKYFSNWELSGARALSAANYLIEQGIESNRMSAVAAGQYRPLGDNNTEDGRALNRRIEINIIRQE